MNFGKFRLRDPQHLMEERDATWDSVLIIESIERIRNLQERFWSQLDSTQPDSYLADGEALIFVTRDSALFHFVAKSLAK